MPNVRHVFHMQRITTKCDYKCILLMCRLFGYFPYVMEAVNLQIFKLGRPEHVRTVTKETVAFVRIFHDDNFTVSGRPDVLFKSVT